MCVKEQCFAAQRSIKKTREMKQPTAACRCCIAVYTLHVSGSVIAEAAVTQGRMRARNTKVSETYVIENENPPQAAP